MMILENDFYNSLIIDILFIYDLISLKLFSLIFVVMFRRLGSFGRIIPIQVVMLIIYYIVKIMM